jgi:hypothetical protein
MQVSTITRRLLADPVNTVMFISVAQKQEISFPIVHLIKSYEVD